VTDVAGNTALVLDREITVNNAVAPTGPRASVTVGVSGGEPAGEETAGGKGQTSSSGGGQGGCRRPKLKMHLARKPLWYTRPKHVPVLRYGRHYPYKGKLTCLSASGKRIPAATGTQVKVYYRVWNMSFKRHHGPVKYYLLRKIKVREKGQIKVSLGFRSGRTILFRYNGPSGELAKAKLRLAVPPRSRKPPWGPR